MKNYKSILLASISIIIINNSHITQTHDDSAWDRFWHVCTDFLRTESAYEDYLNQFRDDLRGLSQKDINSIIRIARQKLINRKPENDHHINQLMREAIKDELRNITIITAKHYTSNKEEIDASVRSMIGNVKARLDRGDNLNGLALKQFFDRNSLKKLVLQNVKTPYTSQSTYINPAYSPPQPIQRPAPTKPSNSTAYHVSYDDYLEQLKHNLKGIPTQKINTIVAMGRQELLRQKPTNDHKRINIMNEAVVNCIRMDTHTIASRLTNDQTAVDNTVRSMSGNVKARLARGDNLNGQALAQFFGPSLERMVKQNISGAQSAKKVESPKPAPFIQFAPSAPEEPTQGEENDCCITGNNCTEEFGVGNIPCKNGVKHSEKICSSCVLQLTTCPICREKLVGTGY